MAKKKSKDKLIGEQRAREVAVYSMSVIATLIHILEKSKMVNVDAIATDVHKYLQEHNRIINRMVDEDTSLEEIVNNEKARKNSKV